MALSGTIGAVGWAPQAAKGTAGTAGNTYWHKAISSSFSVQQLDQLFPMEVGGGGLPTGAYKGGYWVGGDMQLAPRVTKALGWLLYAFAGAVTSTGSDPYVHIFPGEADTLKTKWLTCKRIVPEDDGSYVGEQFVDCIPVGLTIDATPGNILSMRVGLAGLTSSIQDLANLTGTAGWRPSTDNSGYEDFGAVPIACRGTFELPDGTPITNMKSMTLNLVNNVPQQQSEMVLGSYSPASITVLSRMLTVTGVYEWRDAALWKNICYNGGTAWSPTVWTGGQPFEMTFETPGTPFNDATGQLGFYAPTMHWAISRPPQLRGGDILQFEVTGTVLDTNAGEDWRVYIRNSNEAYSWPT